MRMDAESIEMMNKEIQTRGKSKIVIPDNATNGDVIRALFPNVKVEHGLYGINGVPLIFLNLGTRNDVHEMAFVEDWWDAPYKENDNANAN